MEVAALVILQIVLIGLLVYGAVRLAIIPVRRDIHELKESLGPDRSGEG